MPTAETKPQKESPPPDPPRDHAQPEVIQSSSVEIESRFRQLHDRLMIARYIRYAFLPLLVLTVLCVLFLGYIILIGQGSNNPTAAMAFASSVQVVFGMATGYVCVFIGLMMTWFGIEAAYSFDGAVEAGGTKGNLALKSASPGLVFALGGMILIAVSLYKPIVYEETGSRPVYVGQTQQPNRTDGQEVKPLPAPPVDASIQQEK